MYRTVVKRVLLFLCALALTLLSHPTLAHPMPNSVLLLDIHARSVTGELQISLSDLSLAMQDDLLSEQQSVEVGTIRINPVDGTIPPLEIDRTNGTLWTGFVSMFKLGMSHIHSDTDHLLFLLTLLLAAPFISVSGRWRRFASTRRSVKAILKVVTAFTIGHSLTLILGAVVPFSLPTQPIEVLIALSILISAFHALRPLFPHREMLVAGGFGLVHRMAFSFTLAALNLSRPQMALSLLGFNLDIEAMQLLIMILIMPWLIVLAQTPVYRPVRVLGAAISGLAALGWLSSRLGYANSLGAIADGLNPYGPWVVDGLAGLALTSLVAKQRFKRT